MPRLPHRYRVPFEGAVWGWLFALVNDWRESATHHGKGTWVVITLVVSVAPLALASVLGVIARDGVLADIRAEVEDGSPPPPSEIMLRAIGWGTVFGVLNILAWAALVGSGFLVVLSSIVISSLVSGAWVGRELVLQVHGEQRGRAASLVASVVPAASLATLVASFVVPIARMSLEGAILWVFGETSFQGFAATAAFSVPLSVIAFPIAIVCAFALYAGRTFIESRVRPSRRARGLTVLVFLIASVGCVMSGALLLRILDVGGGPDPTILPAIVRLRGYGLARTLLFVDGVLLGAIVVLFMLLADGVSSLIRATTAPKLGAYRTAATASVYSQ